MSAASSGPSPKPEAEAHGDGNVRSVERAMLLLVALAEAPEPATLQQLIQKAGCSASSASRILSTMLKHRVVAQDPVTRKYRLGSQLAALAHAQGAGTDLRTVAAPHLRRLRELTNETASLQALVDTTSVCLAREESTHQLRFTVALGQSWALSRLGATSRVMIAFLDPRRMADVLSEAAKTHDKAYAQRLRANLPNIRLSGMTRTWAERVPGSASMAAALFDSTDAICGAICISGPGDRLTSALMDQWEGELRRVAQAISQELGFRGTYPASSPAPSTAPSGGGRRVKRT
jgi:IclR family KDG regulon transcriptional repressor